MMLDQTNTHYYLMISKHFGISHRLMCVCVHVCAYPSHIVSSIYTTKYFVMCSVRIVVCGQCVSMRKTCLWMYNAHKQIQLLSSMILFLYSLKQTHFWFMVFHNFISPFISLLSLNIVFGYNVYHSIRLIFSVGIFIFFTKKNKERTGKKVSKNHCQPTWWKLIDHIRYSQTIKMSHWIVLVLTAMRFILYI